MRKTIGGLLIMLFCAGALHSGVVSATIFVDSIETYNTYGTEEVVVIYFANGARCWIAESDPGYKAMKVNLFIAAAMQNEVDITFHDDMPWSGDAAAYKMYAIKVHHHQNR